MSHLAGHAEMSIKNITLSKKHGGGDCDHEI